MSYTFRPARRENVPLLLGFAGGTGSGKTMSALRVARGVAAGQPFAGIDTENGRMSLYADHFPELRVTDITAPFRPATYTEAIDAAEQYLEQQGVPLANRVIVVDSMSHEWAGDGGCLDWHAELTGGDQRKNPVGWAKVKPAHKKMVSRLLQVKAHVILCFRAEPKIDIVRENGEVKFVPKQSITGLDGWLPITEKMLPYELTASLMLMADAPGVPLKIKLPEDLAPFVPLDKPIEEQTGSRLAEWARGGSAATDPAPEPTDTEVDQFAFDAGGTEPANGGMTTGEFSDNCERQGVSPQKVAGVGRSLFPGRSSKSLTDVERQELWDAISDSLEVPA